MTSSHSKDADCESVTSHGDVCVDNLCVACGATPGFGAGGCDYHLGGIDPTSDRDFPLRSKDGWPVKINLLFFFRRESAREH